MLDGPMIFARRALQRRLSELRRSLPTAEVDRLAVRMDKANRDRTAAMWEVVVVHALQQLGEVQLETPLISGRRPDIAFSGPIAFTTDVTTVSDEGLDEANPFQDLMEKIEAAKTTLGLPIGGVDLQILEKEVLIAGGKKRQLRLPLRGRLDDLVHTSITPALKAQINAGEKVLRVVMDDAVAGFTLTIDPARSPYSTGGYGSYASPTVIDSNPLYSALKGKAKQLKGAGGLTGVIVGDASTSSMREPYGRSTLSPRDIALEFLRQHKSVGFVVMLTIQESQRSVFGFPPPNRSVASMLVTRPDEAARPSLDSLFAAVVSLMPVPAMMPVNGALRAQEPGYDLGHHGAYEMQGSKIRVSARELVETLAGLRNFGDDGAKYVEAKRKRPSSEPNRIEATFLRELKLGRLPVEIRVIKGSEDDNDDWIEFEFGRSDPAIAPFE